MKAVSVQSVVHNLVCDVVKTEVLSFKTVRDLTSEPSSEDPSRRLFPFLIHFFVEFKKQNVIRQLKTQYRILLN